LARFRSRQRTEVLTLSLDEFLRRFLLDVLPKGFVRIRHFGFLAARRRATTLPLCSQLLGAAPPTEQNGSYTEDADPVRLCPKMRSADEHHRKACGCSNLTSFSTDPGCGCRMSSPPTSRSFCLFPQALSLVPACPTNLYIPASRGRSLAALLRFRQLFLSHRWHMRSLAIPAAAPNPSLN
jgi:hypothetical protein